MSVNINGSTGVSLVQDGVIVDADIADVAASKLTGALPAISGASLTGLPEPAELSTASGSAPSYSARAWVNFNGTGTVAIRESGNVSSITDNGTGDYTVNFTTAMPDANYSVVFGGIGGAPSGAQIMIGVKATGGVSTSSDLKTTTQLRINLSTAAPTYSVIDNTEISASIFR